MSVAPRPLFHVNDGLVSSSGRGAPGGASARRDAGFREHRCANLRELRAGREAGVPRVGGALPSTRRASTRPRRFAPSRMRTRPNPRARDPPRAAPRVRARAVDVTFPHEVST